jgi:hypothetical protein
MKPKTEKPPCRICNPDRAEDHVYCEKHQEELHQLEHRYDGFFRFQRAARGKDHEVHDLYLESQCDPCGRILLQETDPENLAVTVLLADDIHLDALLPEYDALGIRLTWGDLLRSRISLDLVQGWYGNAHACVDVFRIDFESRVHWDLDPADEDMEEDPGSYEPHSHGEKGSVH